MYICINVYTQYTFYTTNRKYLYRHRKVLVTSASIARIVLHHCPYRPPSLPAASSIIARSASHTSVDEFQHQLYSLHWNITAQVQSSLHRNITAQVQNSLHRHITAQVQNSLHWNITAQVQSSLHRSNTRTARNRLHPSLGQQYGWLTPPHSPCSPVHSSVMIALQLTTKTIDRRTNQNKMNGLRPFILNNNQFSPASKQLKSDHPPLKNHQKRQR